MPLQPVTPFTPAGRLRPGTYYRHSGGLNPVGLGAALVAGSVAAVAIGFCYAYADKYIPEVHLSAFACAAAAAALGYVPAVVMRQTKVRHLPAALAVIGLVAVVGLYASWATWEATLTRSGLANLPELAAHPRRMADYAVHINAVGTWSIGSTGSSSSSHPSATSGVFLWLIWAVEAVTLVGVPLLVGKSMLAGKPFCDACDRWCDGPVTVRVTGTPADVGEVRRRLDAGDFAYVAALGPPAQRASLTFARHRCDQCRKLHTLTVTSKTVKLDRKGRAQAASSKVLVNKLLVSAEDLAVVAPPPPPTGAVAVA